MNNYNLRNTDTDDNMFGEKEHQVVARKALPILIERAKARKPITYGDLGRKLEIDPHGNPMSTMLGSIVTTLAQLGKQWNEELPHLTALVVTRSTNYPSYPPDTPNEVFDAEFERIYIYPKWDVVLHKLLPEPSSDALKSVAEELRGIREDLQSIKEVLINIRDAE